MAIDKLNTALFDLDTPQGNLANRASLLGQQLLEQARLEKDRAWQDETRSRQKKLWEQEDKDKALNEAFRQGLTGPKQIQSGVITDQYLASPTLQQMELTPEELVDYKAYMKRGKTGELSPTIVNKLKAQEDFGTGVVKMASDPAFQETELEQARRIAGQLDGGTKHIYDRLKSIEAADLTARKEKKDKVAKLGETKSGLEEEKNKLRVALQKATVAKNKARSDGKSTGGTTGGSSGSKFEGLSNADMLASVKKFGFSEDGRWFSVFANDSEAKEAANQLDKQGVLTLLNMSGLNDKGKKKALEDALAKAQIKGRRGWFSSDAEFDDLRKDVQSTIVEMVKDKEYSAKLDPLEQEYTNQIAQINQRIRGLDNEIENQSLDRGELLGKNMNLKSSDWLNKLIGKKEMSSPKEVSGTVKISEPLNVVKGSYQDKVLATETKNRDYKNHRKDSEGKTETLGAYQFVPSTLANLQKETGEKFTHEEFLANPALQDKYFKLLTDKNANQLKQNGFETSDFNLWLMHNLGGGGQTKNFLSNEPLTEMTKKAIALNLPKGVEPTRENYIARFGSRFGKGNPTNIKQLVTDISDKKLAPTKENLEKINKRLMDKKDKGVSVDSIVRPYVSIYDSYQENIGQPFVNFINKYAPGGNR